MNKKSFGVIIAFVILSLVMLLTACQKQMFVITVEESDHGLISVASYNAKEGDSITVTVTPNTGYKLKEDTLKFNDTLISGNVFTMPGGNVTVKAEFIKIEYSVTITDTPSGRLTVDKVVAGPGEYVNITVLPDDGYRLKPSSLQLNGMILSGTTFSMPNSNAIISAVFETMPIGMNQISVDKELINGRIVPNRTEAKVGDIVSVTVTADNGYALKVDTLKYNGIAIAEYTFTMPDAEVVITAQFEKQYTVTISDNMVNGTLRVDKVRAVEGETITIAVKSGTMYQLKEGSLTYDDTQIVGRTFVMPNKNVTVKGEFEVFNSYKRINIGGEEDEKGKYMLFGMYPQSIKPGDVTIDETTEDENGYFTANTGDKYIKIKATPYSDTYRFSTSATVVEGNEYFFKVEPIKWRILFEEDGILTLGCETIIDCGSFLDKANVSVITDNDFYNIKAGTPEKIYANNWVYSDIRTWLNDVFFKKAFSDLQKKFITLSELDNSNTAKIEKNEENNKYAVGMPNTSDNVFLMSYKDATSAKYGHESSDMVSDSVRRKITSDYSRAKGTYMDTVDYNGNGIWMLRSPTTGSSKKIAAVSNFGTVHSDIIENTYVGIAPSVVINIVK